MKRINVKLLVVLLCVFFVSVATVYGVYTFQMGRAAQTMLAQAEAYYENGDLKNAIKNQQRYLQYHPEDHERLGQLALWTKAWFESLISAGTAVGPREFNRAYGLIERALRESPDNFELREAAIDFCKKFGRDGDAVSHLTYVIERMPDQATPEHFMDRTLCYVRLAKDSEALDELESMIGFDDSTRSFSSAANATMPEHVKAYRLLAAIYRERRQDPDTADAIVEQMVNANPESADAFKERALYQMALDSEQEESLQRAKTDIDKALELSPDDDEILVAAAGIYQELEDFPRAKELLDQHKEQNSEDVDVYRLLSNWALKQEEVEQARAFIKQGLDKSPSHRGLLWARGNLELENREFDKVKKTMEALRELGYRKSFLQFLEGRVDIANGRWIKAKNLFKEIRPELVEKQPTWVPGLDRALAFCHQQLGEYDEMLRVFQDLQDRDPNDLLARWGEIEALRALRQTDTAIERYLSLLSQQSRSGLATPEAHLISHLEMEMLRQQRLDETDRDWTIGDALANNVYKNELIAKPTRLLIVKRYFEQKGEQEKAEKLGALLGRESPEYQSPKLDEIRQLARTDVEQAIQKLDELEKTNEENAATILLRIELLSLQGAADLRNKLGQIESRIGALSDQQQARVYEHLGTAYMHTADYDGVRRAWRAAADRSPQNIDMRIQLFEFELKAGEEAEMVAALDQLKKAAGADSAVSKYAEAARVVWRVASELDGKSELGKARALIEDAKALRSRWDPLFRLEAEIYLLNENTQMAITSLQKAMEYGRPRPQSIRNLTRLLVQASRYEEAKQSLELMPRSTWTQSDESLYMRILTQTGQLPDTLTVDWNSTDPLYLLEIGNMLTKAGRFEDAEKAIRNSLDLAPSLPTSWRTLVYLLIRQDRKDEAEAAVRQARVEVSEEAATLLLGQCYKMLGNFGDAFEHFQTHLSANPDSVDAMREIATLFIAARRTDEALEYLDRIIGTTSSDSSTFSPDVAWARRTKAQMLAATNTYHDFLVALGLIEENAGEGGVMAPDDMLLFARLSANRNDGVSRDNAIKKLEEVKNNRLRQLTNQELLVLAELYKKQDRWTECETVMNSLLAYNRDDMRLLTPWLSWLLDENKLQLAETWLKRCQPNSLAARRTRAQLMARRGKSQEAANSLLSLIPKDLPPEQDQTLITVASLLEELGQFDEQILARSEEVWRLYASRHPEDTLRLAAYLGRRGDPKQLQEAFQICQQRVNAGDELAAIPVGVGLLRLHRAKLEQGSPYHAQVRGWFEKAQRSAPDSVSLMIQRSEFEDLVGDYRAVERWLKAYLDSNLVTPHQRAMASNNLAYILALQNRGDEAMELIKYAIDILGPLADLRDTRAMAYLAQGQPMEAVKDLDAAIADGGETPFKFFHKALAELKAGNQTSAATAIQRAKELGLELSSLSQLERRQYDSLAKQLGDVLRSSDKRSDATAANAN